MSKIPRPASASCLLFWPALAVAAIFSAIFGAGCDSPPPEPETDAAVPVMIEVVQKTAFRPSVRLLGTVEPAARIALRSDAAGRVVYPPRFASGLRTGEEVRTGELLFTVDSPEVRLAAAEAELQAEAAEAELERSRQGVEGGFVSAAVHTQNQIQARIARERLSNARRGLERLAVRAPVGGVLRVGETVPPGTQVEAGRVLAELAAAGDLRVEAWVAASDLTRLATGYEARLLTPGQGREVGAGRVAELSRAVDDGGVARLVVDVREDRGMPRVGNGVEVEVLLPERSDVLTVPERALLVQGGVATVFVLDPAGSGFRASSRLVIPGGRHQGRVEIADGLSAGDRIAVEGAELLADGLTAIDADREKKPWEE